ncbi:MAG: DUF11 domain-containing protein, partial [Phycisphaerae bacterium]|nr:DUF11 domain-containing protein [Saprospiraceae bacterium]
MKKILLSLFLFLSTYNLWSQNNFWQEAKGPYGGDFDLVKTTNEVLYVTNVSGWQYTFRSSDGGASWDQLNFLQSSFPNAKDKVARAGAAGTVFMLVYTTAPNSSWYRTNNDGQTWVEMADLTNYFVETPGGVMLCTKSNKLVRSTDGGQNWVNSLIYNRELHAVNDPAVGLIAVDVPNAQDTSRVIFRSPDNGLSWDTIQIPFLYDNYLFTNSGTLFCTSNKILYRSDNNGGSFQPTNITNALTLNGTTLQSGRIVARLDFDDYYSDNDGVNWQKFGPQVQGFFGNYAPVSPLASGKIFRNSYYGIYSSINAGLSWQFSGNGLRPGEVEDFKFVTDSLFYGGNMVGVWRTADAGETWTQLSQNSSLLNSSSPFQITSTGGIVLTQDYQLLYSANGIDNFVNITPSNQLPQYTTNYIFKNPANDHLFINTKTGLERSKDLGQNWEMVYAAEYAKTFASMVFHPSGRIIASDYEKKVYFSDNEGSLWQPLVIQNIGSFQPIKVAPNGDIYAFRTLYLDNALWKSEDAGASWTKLPPTLSFIYYSFGFLDIAADGHVYITDGYDNVYVSANEGLTWQTLPSPFAGTNDHNLANINISPNQYLYVCSTFNGLFKSGAPISNGAYIKGRVRIDADADCSTPDAQNPLKNRVISAAGENFEYFSNTDLDGNYVFFVDTGNYQVIAHNPNSLWWHYCEDTMVVELPELLLTDTADFVSIPISFCPLITVHVAVPQLRRCFDNEVYVEYCNQGAELADSAWVDILLDPYLSFVSSAQPHTLLGNDSIRFFVGNLPSGDCGQFQLTVHVECDSTVLGQTHCINAHGFPDTLCTTVPNWSGANIEASVTCQDTTLQFHLKNTGNAHSQILDFIVFEDDVVLMTGEDEYDIADDVVFDFPANGSTWRIESEQEPGHPFSNLVLAFSEGCGGFGSLGYINQFPVNGIQPAWHRMCVENTGSFDPNDKQGFPTGTGSEHNIRPGQTIDYLIRFQNTGTDTAFTVEVRDTLSAFLDPINIRPGASSHPYIWELSGQGVISFTFSNIMLPDSNVNEPASHGFVQFSIAPYADVPLGS